MKKVIYCFFCCLLGLSTAITSVAQTIYTPDSIELKRRIYKVALVADGSKHKTGYLASFSDSNLYASPSAVPFGSVNIDDQLTSYSYDKLENIELKRKGAVLRGAWHGALVGLAVGVIAGLVSGDDPKVDENTLFGPLLNTFALTAGEKAAGGGILGALGGACVGALLGSFAKKKFMIGRNKEKFHSMSQEILEKLSVHKINSDL
ncbi:MAG: hypothetical protein ABI416_00845 [Ginsengibacter sp.]